MGTKDPSLITKAPVLAHVFEVLKGCFTFGLGVVSSGGGDSENRAP